MKKLFNLLKSIAFPKIHILEEVEERELVLDGEVIMTNKIFTTWYGGMNPRVESYEETVNKSGVVMKGFDFTTYHYGLIAEGRNVSIRRSYTKEKRIL